MKPHSKNTVELSHVTPLVLKSVDATVEIFRDAVEFVGNVIDTHWETLRGLSPKKRLNAIEKLIHTTKKHVALYPEFDEKFYKFPTYYRRSVISFALGQIASYKTRLQTYEAERHKAISAGKRFRKKAPKLNLKTNVFPIMYKTGMYTFDTNTATVCLKLFIKNTWNWVELGIVNKDLKYIRKTIENGGTIQSPTLRKKGKKVYLDFPIQWKPVKFPKTDVANQRILAVDLGVNHGAVCCVMDLDGTIVTRAFDPFVSERDQLNHLLNRLRKIARQSGKGQRLSKVYTKLDGVKTNYTRKLAHWIKEIAKEHNVYGIVFERFGRMKPKWKKDKIHHWCKQKIIELVCGMALREGIRVFLINPRNTSKLAFDGSGPVKRDTSNVSLCTFSTGKRYHADLNASYNIGARYFIRAISKSMSETAWSKCTAKVPTLSRRTDCTLSTLLQFNATLAELFGKKKANRKSIPVASMQHRSDVGNATSSVRQLSEPVHTEGHRCILQNV